MRELLESLVGQMVEHGVTYEDAIAEFEKRFIKRVLEESKGNRSKAASALGIHRNTLSRKIDGLGLGLDHRPKRKKHTSR